MRILIVGAGGFIGGFIVAEALNRGYDTWCGIRQGTSRRYLGDSRLHFLVFDYENPEAMLEKAPEFDIIVYNLGATKCVNFADFNLINFTYLKNFATALVASGKVPKKFVYMSSLSALGPGDEVAYRPLTDKDIPAPNTRYGLSKLKAETFLQTLPDFPWVILRPTGVYGPHEQDYMMMINAIKKGLDVGAGYRRQLLTFIYVSDLANAILDAADRAPAHHKYILSEPRAYTQAEFRQIVKKAHGKKFVIPLRLPLWAVKMVSVIAEKYGAATLRPTTLNRDKFRIMAQRNWSCDISAAQKDWGFSPQVTLEDGIERTVQALNDDK